MIEILVGSVVCIELSEPAHFPASPPEVPYPWVSRVLTIRDGDGSDAVSIKLYSGEHTGAALAALPQVLLTAPTQNPTPPVDSKGEPA